MIQVSTEAPKAAPDYHAAVPEEWMDQAACTSHDPELWHPRTDDYQPAITICRTCPVTAQCLAFADQLETGRDAHGIYGALTPQERTKRRNTRRTN